MKEGTTDSNQRPRRASLIKATESIKKVAAPKKKRDDVYEVEAIISHVVVDNEPLYRVTWVGYPGEVTELTEDELSNCTELLQAYKDKVKESGDISLLTIMEPHSDQDSGETNKAPPDSSKGTKKAEKPHSENGEKVSSTPSEAKKKKKRNAQQDGEVKPNGDVSSAKKSRRTKRTIASDAELGYTNGCKVDVYKGFSAKQYDEPVILVSYKEPLPSGFEDRHDEIVPIRLIAKSDPQGLISHLVELLSGGRGNVTI
uniref:Chromo domain-containing protein n=1 Tax=Haemonchus contortus TaxID=6289 RepID=A0A7I4YNM8_HAECO